MQSGHKWGVHFLLNLSLSLPVNCHSHATAGGGGRIFVMLTVIGPASVFEIIRFEKGILCTMIQDALMIM